MTTAYISLGAPIQAVGREDYLRKVNLRLFPADFICIYSQSNQECPALRTIICLQSYVIEMSTVCTKTAHTGLEKERNPTQHC